MGCLENLLDTFTRKDINALAQKADNLQTDIRQGFDRDTFFVKSTSTSKPHIVQRVPGSRDGYSCDKECLGFVSRKICAHTVAVANFSHNLPQFVTWFKKSRRHKENLTSLTTFAVNKAAGRKKSNQQVRQRKKSPDVMRNMASNKGTLSEPSHKLVKNMLPFLHQIYALLFEEPSPPNRQLTPQPALPLKS